MGNAKFDHGRKNYFFQNLTISKIIHLSLTNVPTDIISELNKIQKEFIWNVNNQTLNTPPYVTNMKMVA